MLKSKLILIIGIVFVAGIATIIILNKNRENGLQTSTTGEKNLQTEKIVSQVGNDICGEFPKEWVESVTGKTIIKTESISGEVTNVCQYYVDDNNFITLRLNNLSAENQKKGQVTLGRTITTNDKIGAEHFIAIQENGLINGIYIIINPHQFLAVDRTSTKALSETEIIDFAGRVSEKINTDGSPNTENITKKKAVEVPLPQETDIVRTFFNIIGENRPSDAVSMMSQKAIGDESSKQAWTVQLNAFKTVQVENIMPSMQEEWTENSHTYKVNLNVEMKPEAAGAPIPYYGWENGSNTRFIHLSKEQGLWKIDGITTGP